MSGIDSEWDVFLQNQFDPFTKGLLEETQYSESNIANNKISNEVNNEVEPNNAQDTSNTEMVVCEELYISTQTRIFFLNVNKVDVIYLFWNIPVISYSEPRDGIIKKQIRIISNSRDDFHDYIEKRNLQTYYSEKIIKQIDNPNARKIKFKDVRKLTIGMSKKDIMSCHGKNKNAFINCFVMILRVKHSGKFHEIHVKVFNTGRIAIPGIVNEELLQKTTKILLDTLQKSISEKLLLIPEEESPEVERLVKGKINKETKKKEKSYYEKVKPKSNVLINSNFNCGYYIRQDKLRNILRDKYGLNPVYDPSMYPGVKCKFYYKNDLPNDPLLQQGKLEEQDQSVTMTELDELTLEKYTKVSFMIFRTGNCLIVGNCTKEILSYVYEFVKNILSCEYEHIQAIHDHPVQKMKKPKPRKKQLQFTKEYYDDLYNS